MRLHQSHGHKIKKMEIKSKMNKRGDIPIMVLVIGIIALCGIALLSFHIAGKRQAGQNLDSVYYLQEVYTLAESVRYSGKELYGEYGKEVKFSGNEYMIEKTFTKGEVEILRIKYTFPS